MSSDNLTTEVKETAKRWGAVLVGVAPVERFDPMPPLYDKVPEGHHPKDYLPGARSVISVAQPILNAAMDAPAVLAARPFAMVPPMAKYPYFELLYNHVAHVVQDTMLLFVAQAVGQYLMSHGYDSMIFPVQGLHPEIEGMTDREIWEGPDEEWARKYSPFRCNFGPFSHRHAATRAGLGEFGYNNLVLTPQFGPRQRFNSIITDAELVPDPLIDHPVCLRDKCNLCRQACIADCIHMRDDESREDYRSVPDLDRGQIFIDTPAMTDPPKCRRRRDGIPDSPVRGDCIRVCPVPSVPKNLTDRLQGIYAGHPSSPEKTV